MFVGYHTYRYEYIDSIDWTIAVQYTLKQWLLLNTTMYIDVAWSMTTLHDPDGIFANR
jgi:hypothetical protein